MKFPVLIVGDLHLKHTNIEQFHEFQQHLHGADFQSIIFLGDIFDSAELVKWSSLLEFQQFLETYKHLDLFFLSGNHDRPLFGQHRSTLEIFSSYGKVITSPTVFDDILWIPYVSNSEVVQALENFKFHNPPKFCFAHLMIDGAFISKEYTAKGLPPQLFAGFVFVVNGHIHKPQIIENIYCAGSPWQHSFAEADQQKFFWLWDGSEKLRAIPSNAPLYVVCSADQIPTLDLSGKCVKVILREGETDPQEIAAQLTAQGARRWILAFTDVETPTRTVSSTPISEFDWNSLLAEYVRVKNMDNDDLELGMFFVDGVDL